jgi:hypothetical protein
MSPAASISHNDDWGAANQTAVLLGHTGAGRGSGMAATSVGAPQPRDYSAAYRSLGLGSNESAGQTQVQAPGGRAGHGADVSGSGMPGLTDPSDPGGVPGGLGDAAGGADAAGAELADLAPLVALA